MDYPPSQTIEARSKKKLDCDWEVLLDRLESIHNNFDNTEIYITASRADIQRLIGFLQPIRRSTVNIEDTHSRRKDALWTDLANLTEQADRMAETFQLVRSLLREASDQQHEKSWVKKTRFVEPGEQGDLPHTEDFPPDVEKHSPHVKEERSETDQNQPVSPSRLTPTQRNKTLQETLALIRGFGSNTDESNTNEADNGSNSTGNDTAPIVKSVEKRHVTKQSTTPLPVAAERCTPPKRVSTSMPARQKAPPNKKSPVSPTGKKKLPRTVTDLYKSDWLWFGKPAGISIQDFVQAKLAAKADAPPPAKRKRPNMTVPDVSDTEGYESDETLRQSIKRSNSANSGSTAETVELPANSTNSGSATETLELQAKRSDSANSGSATETLEILTKPSDSANTGSATETVPIVFEFVDMQ